VYNPENSSLERYYQEPSDYNKGTYQTKNICLEGISACRFNYYDGTSWQDRWEESKNEIPKAIRVTFKFPDEEREREFVAYIPISP
jgi:hypothetical protein